MAVAMWVLWWMMSAAVVLDVGDGEAPGRQFNTTKYMALHAFVRSLCVLQSFSQMSCCGSLCVMFEWADDWARKARFTRTVLVSDWCSGQATLGPCTSR